MDISKLRAITNNYQQVRLISLKDWKSASEIITPDLGGPYMVCQEGYDPLDFKMTPDEFVLGKSGKWLSLGFFFKMPRETRRREFIFGGAAEVMNLLHSLPSKAAIIRPGELTLEEPDSAEDDLNTAFLAAKEKSGAPPANGMK